MHILQMQEEKEKEENNKNNTNFIEKQVNFLYGANVIAAIKNHPCGHIELDESTLLPHVLNQMKNESLSLTSLEPNTKLLPEDRWNYLQTTLQKYWPKDGSKGIFGQPPYIIYTTMHDSVYNIPNVIAHNRRVEFSNSQCIFPLYNYSNPAGFKKYINVSSTAAADIPFAEKKNGIFWRGSSTGRPPQTPPNPNTNIRVYLVRKYGDGKNLVPDIDIGFTHFCQSWNAAHFASPDAVRKRVPIGEQCDTYKFLLNIEGNDFSSSFVYTLIHPTVCPLHVYPFNFEHYLFGCNLQPYVHFVPVQVDVNAETDNLQEQYEWCLTHMQECKQIALNGAEYMKPYLDDQLYDDVLRRFVELYPFVLKQKHE